MAGPSHTDLSTLWVPIMPSTDGLNDAMEKVGQDATESFGKGSEKLGDKITDSFSKSRDKIKDVFHRTGEESGKSMSDAFQEHSKTIEATAEDTGKKAGGKLSSAFSDSLSKGIAASGSKLDGLAEKASTVGAKLTDGFGAHLKEIDGYAKDVGLDISALTGPFSTLDDDAKKIGGEIKDWSSSFEKMPGKIGVVASAISELAIPLAMVEQGIEKVNDMFDKAGGQRHWDDVVNPPDGGGGFSGLLKSWMSKSDPNGGGPQPPHDFWGSGKTPGFSPLGPGLSNMLLPAGGPTTGPAHDFWGSKSPGFRPSGAGGGVPLVQKPDGTWTSSNPAWAHLISRESGGDPGIYNHSDSNAAAGDPSQGLFQFTRSTWASHGGLKYGADPSKATPQQQAEIAANLIKANPSGSDWGAGLPGRENASALLSGIGGKGGAIADGWSPSQGFSRSPSGKAPPLGSKDDPVFTAFANGSGASGGGGSAGGGGASGGGEDSGGALTQQFGSKFLGGIGQSIGLDGSVFKGFGGASNPMDFGITKLGTGLLNAFMPKGGRGSGVGVDHSIPDDFALGAPHAALPGIEATPGGATGTATGPMGRFAPPGGGGGGGGTGLSGGPGGGATALFQGAMKLGGAFLSDLAPGPGAASAHDDHAINLPVTHNHFYGDVNSGLTVHQTGVKGGGVQDMQHANNAAQNRAPALSANLPA